MGVIWTACNYDWGYLMRAKKFKLYFEKFDLMRAKKFKLYFEKFDLIGNLQVQEPTSPCQPPFSPEAKVIYSFQQNLKNIKITTMILKDHFWCIHLLGQNDLRHFLLGLLVLPSVTLKARIFAPLTNGFIRFLHGVFIFFQEELKKLVDEIKELEETQRMTSIETVAAVAQVTDW